MYRVEGRIVRDFYTDEPTLLKNVCTSWTWSTNTSVDILSDFCDPTGYIKPWAEPLTNPWRLKANGHRVVAYPVLLYCDDTSGNQSKKWNEHNTFLMNAAGLPREHMQWEHNLSFICTSNIAPPLEMLEGIVEQIESCQETGKDVTDMLEVGGVKRETVQGMVGAARTTAETQSVSHRMLENASTLARQKENVDLQTSTGVKDTILHFFLDKLEKARKSLGGDAARQATQEAYTRLPANTFSPYFWRDAVECLSAVHKATIEAHLSSLDISGLGPDVAKPHGHTLVHYAGSLVGCDFRLISQVAVFVLYDMLETKILDAWAALCVLVPLPWMPKIENLDDYMAELNVAIKRFMDCTACWTPQWFNKPKFHLILHIVDHIRRFGPVITFAMEVHKSYNSIVCGWSINSNQMALSLDIARRAAGLLRLWHLLSGGYFEVESDKSDGTTQTKWIQAGVNPRTYGEQPSIITCKLGFPLSESFSCIGMICKKSKNAPSHLEPDFGREVIVCNGDPVALDSFMVFHVQDHFLIGRVAEILTRGQDFEGKADWILLQCYNTGPLVQPYWMPSLSKTERYHLVTPEQINCTVNVQHNCAANRCNLSSSRPVFLKWEHQVEGTQAVRHNDDRTEDLILNMAKMRDAKFISKFREAAPPLDTDSLINIVCESELAAAAPVPSSAGQKHTHSSYNDKDSDDELDQSLTSQVPQSGAIQLPATAVPPAGSIQVGPEVIAAITQMYSLNSERLRSLQSYALAAGDMPLPAKMTSLMSFTALNKCLQLVEETTTKVATFSSELAVLKGLIKTSWVVDDALKAQFTDMVKWALIKEDRTNFVNMYQDILDIEQHPDELKIAKQIKAKTHKAAIVHAICNACNNVCNNARKFLHVACQILVSVQDGPLCLTLEDFAVKWLAHFNPAAVAIPLPVTLLAQVAQVAQVVQICDFAMHNLELLDLDRNDNDENDEGATPAPTSHRVKKKAKVDMAEPKFWKRFKTHLHVQDKDGYQRYIGELITKDHARFGKPNTTVSQGVNILGPSTNPHALMTADHDLNNMLVTMFDHSVCR
ncbi:uncharacterized protein EDB91DRAFT_1282289 [Suillus paluster]|uniref:uncharacterized protein n=1 Tax=Suillus paluster TaxID=48578 RepID=UPI001B875A2D|nr:uncharacterized protein EDB91DRAFT_1282289 [Suillus paluster]KAG1740436.1 hypothetical protein EDB91DRAFT_1282289 [Suillus paluster]